MGRVQYANGDVYVGEFKKGDRHGDGVLKIKSPRVSPCTIMGAEH